jgi:hypothetical protein
MAVTTTAAQTVLVLNHEPQDKDGVYHTSDDCPMVAYEEARRPGTYFRIPKWVAELGLRRCKNSQCKVQA